MSDKEDIIKGEIISLTKTEFIFLMERIDRLEEKIDKKISELTKRIDGLK